MTTIRSSPTAYVVSLAAVAAAVVARLLLEPLLTDRLPFITLFIAVGFAAWYGGKGHGFLALVVGAVASAFFLLQPRYSFAIDQSENQVGLLLYGVVGFASIAMFESLRKAQRRVEEQRRQLEQELAARRATEQAYAEQAERLRTTLASIGDAVITTDMEARITNMNAVAEKLTGWTTAEAMGQPLDAVFCIVNEATRKAVENPAFRALKEGVIVGLANHTILIAKNGTERPIDDSAAPIRCKDGEMVGCVLVFRDISERHRREAEREERERQFQTLAESIPQLAWMANTDGHIFWYNRRWYEYTGTTPEQIDGWRWQSVHDPKELPKVLERWKTSLATGIPFDMTFPLKGQDGQFRPFLTRVEPVKDDEGRVVRWFGTNTDITELKRAEQALLDSEQRMRLATETTQVGIWEWNVITGELRWDAMMFQIYGIAPTPSGGVQYRDWSESVLPEDLLHQEAVLHDTVERLGSSSRHFRIKRRNDGECRSIECVESVRMNDAGVAEWVVGTNLDVTDRKHADAQLRQLAAELSDAHRRKDEFLATLAHELRNPLAPIRNGLQVIKLADGDGKVIEQSRSMMERQVEQMTRLIDDLMDLSRISQGKIVLQKARMRLAIAVQHAVETSRPLIEQQGHELVLDVPDEPIHVDGDETRLCQVFANILNNAAKYTDRGGLIRLRVRQAGGEVVVTVEDNGVGIPAPMLPKVFDMFTQVERSLEKSQGGLGIGLNIVKRLVEMHSGTIGVKSDGDGMGSRFTVHLPVVEAVTENTPDDATGDKTTTAPRRRILVVDDNRDGAESLAQLLSIMGNETLIAHDGVQAVEGAASFRPDVILMDIGMPKLNGYEACRRIREKAWGKNIVIVACTGWGQEDDKQKSQEAGFDFHMVKPVDPAALVKLVAVPQNVGGDGSLHTVAAS
ncbi:hypothetical protein BH11PLA2_BH11PLA2_47680 [soil metagenome]